MKPALSAVSARQNFSLLPTEKLQFGAKKQMMSANDLVSKQLSVTKESKIENIYEAEAGRC